MLPRPVPFAANRGCGGTIWSGRTQGQDRRRQVFNQHDMSMLVMLLLVGFFIAVPVIASVIRGRNAPRITTTSCRHCGYDLRRLPKGTDCPECGTAVGLTGPGRTVDPDEPSCRGCGPLLANLPWNATCPECGLVNAAMPRFQRLRKRDWFTPGRILQFVLGTAWLLVGIFLMITALAFVFGGLR